MPKNSKKHKRQNIEMMVDDLLEQAYESDDEEEISSLVHKVLELDPDNVEAMLLLSDLIEDDEERMDVLAQAITTVEDLLVKGEKLERGIDSDDSESESTPVPDPDPECEDLFQVVRFALLQRAAFTLFNMGKNEQALEMAEKCVRYELADNSTSREIYYRILIETEQWRKILSETMQDDNHQLGWAYARLFATFMLTSQNQDFATAARMFWEALLMSPNVPFYMLGYFDEPVDEDDEGETEDFEFACLYSDALTTSRDLLNWFTRGTILFGLLSGRLPSDGEEHEFLLDILKTLGGLDEYKKMLDKIKESDDETIIETLAANRCLARL